MYCKECGTLLPDDSVYCKACGKPTGALSAPTVQAVDVRKYNALSIVGFCCAMASWFFFLLAGMSDESWFFGVLWLMSWLVGLIFSVIGWVRAVRCKNKKGLAIAGFASTVFWVGFFSLFLTLVFFTV